MPLEWSENSQGVDTELVNDNASSNDGYRFFTASASSEQDRGRSATPRFGGSFGSSAICTPRKNIELFAMVQQLEELDKVETVHVAVGSTCAAKIRAVSMACGKLFPSISISGFKVASGVSDQPMSDNESMEGALNRAKNAMKLDHAAHYGIGLEGGLQKIGDRWFESGWIAVVNRQGQVGFGTSGRYELSKKIVDRLLSGQEELAKVIDDLTGDVDVRSTQGAMGVLTNGQVPRDLAYTHGLFFAFAPFLSPRHFWE